MAALHGAPDGGLVEAAVISVDPSRGGIEMEFQVEVLEQSFEAILPKEEAFAAAFYDRLFGAHPEVERLFAGVDLGGQSEKLVGVLAVVVENLRRPEVLEPVLRELASAMPATV